MNSPPEPPAHCPIAAVIKSKKPRVEEFGRITRRNVPAVKTNDGPPGQIDSNPGKLS